MKKNSLKRALAALLTAAMLFTALISLRGLDTSVKAQPGGGGDDFPEIVYDVDTGSKIVLGKDAYLTEDGTYTIDLSAYTVGSPNIRQRNLKVPTDYILVIDASTSMRDHYFCQLHADGVHAWDCFHDSSVRAAAKAFIDELRADATVFGNPEWNLDSRVAVVTYATGDTYYNNPSMLYNGTGIYKTEKGADNATFYRYANPAQGQHLASEIYDDAFMSVLDEYNEANQAIDDIQLSSYTAMHLGMEMAKNVIEETANRTTDSQDDHYNKYYDQDAGEWKVRPKVVVLFTDGVSGNVAYSQKSVKQSIEHANAIKATGAKIYTVGLVSVDMFTQHGECWWNHIAGTFTHQAYDGAHNCTGELLVSRHTFREWDKNTAITDGANAYFAAFEKLKRDLNLATDAEALEKYIELQRNQYRLMGLTEGFLYIDPLMAMSSEYDQVDVTIEQDFADEAGRGSLWRQYKYDGTIHVDSNRNHNGWYNAADALDLKVNGERIGARYSAMMLGALNADSTFGTQYASANAIWKKLYVSETANLLVYDEANDVYAYMDVEVPKLDANGEYILRDDLKYYIPLENAFDLDAAGGDQNIQNLISTFKQIEELTVSEHLGNMANTGMSKFSAITDRISENFTVPENLEIGTNIKIWLAQVDNDAMQADPQNDGFNVTDWIFKTPENRTSSVVFIDPSVTTNDELDALVYGQSTFKGGVKYDPATRAFTIVGFRWPNGQWYCQYNPTNGNYSGWKMIVRISGLTANDDVAPANSIPTNDKMLSGMVQHWRDNRPSTIATANGTERLLFPEPTVKIREKRIVYDYGFRLTDSGASGFFAEAGETNDVDQLLAIDYMYRDQKQNGSISYKTEYPYVGASGRDANGNPMTYATEQSVADADFEFGVSGGKGYFEPHAISHSEYQAAALLKLNGTQKDVLGNNINRYEWCKLVAIPATNVLYEAEQGVTGSNLNGNFVSYTNSTFTSSGSWSVEGSFNTAATQQHYNKLYGFDPVYDGGVNGDANGASMAVTVNQDLYDAVKAKTASWPVAKFSFRGSGFSFTSRCGLGTGIFILDVVPHGQDQKYNGSTNHPAAGGYTPVDGDNYHTLVNTRYYGGSETPDGNALLHQIPVFRRGQMPYQDYDVYLTPVYYPAWANDPTQSVSTKSGEEVAMRLDGVIPGVGDIEYTVTNAVENGGTEPTRAKLSSFTSYIDAIRIYHPLGAKVHGKDTAAVAYYNANERNAKYIETRSLLIKSPVLNEAGTAIGGAIFVDYGPASEGGEQHFNANDPTTYTVSDYVKFGPNNEMYLKGMTQMPDGSSRGGSFTFSIAQPNQIKSLHLSMKAHECSSIDVNVTLKFKHSTQTKTVTVNSSTEMYYDLLEALSPGNFNIGNLVNINIACTGEGMLSIANLKVVYNDGYVEPNETDSVNPNIVTTLETVEFANAIAFGVKGDANGDNAADVSDALLIMRKAMGENIEFRVSALYLADVNGDGAIDVSDALATMRIALS